MKTGNQFMRPDNAIVAAFLMLLTTFSLSYFAELTRAENKDTNHEEKALLVGQSVQYGSPILFRKVRIPADYLAQAESGAFGGDVRIGDFTGDGSVDVLIYRCVDDFHDGGGMKPCFLGAFTIDGKALWKMGDGGQQPGRPGPVAVHDMDDDGKAEVICFFRDPAIECAPTSFENVIIQIRDGSTGEIKNKAAPTELRRCRGSGPNWAHQRILVANLRGNKSPRDFVIKLGENVLAFDENLSILWTYQSRWTEYSACPAYVPAVGDIDGDGHDEVNGGYFLIDHDGSVLWERQLGRHMDSVAIGEWDEGRMRAFCSGFGNVVDEKGNTVLELGEEIVPHGQELRVGHFDDRVPGPQMIIRHNGHSPDVTLIGVRGEVIRRFKLNASPNNTGMEVVYWHGSEMSALIYNDGVLWDGSGHRYAALPDLARPFGDQRQGWYHCIPANICGDDREEIVVYNPWDCIIYIYSPAPLELGRFTGYRPGPRQYNPRLMD